MIIANSISVNWRIFTVFTCVICARMYNHIRFTSKLEILNILSRTASEIRPSHPIVSITIGDNSVTVYNGSRFVQ
jgi:hypothetical protein